MSVHVSDKIIYPKWKVLVLLDQFSINIIAEL